LCGADIPVRAAASFATGQHVTTCRFPPRGRGDAEQREAESISTKE
jgi:hypothetical protein